MFVRFFSFKEPGKYPIHTVTIGKFKDYPIVIDNYKDKFNNMIEKRFVWWNDIDQWIVHKRRNNRGRFERYW